MYRDRPPSRLRPPDAPVRWSRRLDPGDRSTTSPSSRVPGEPRPAAAQLEISNNL